MKVIDLNGKTFGRLKVLKRVPVPEGKNKVAYWLCECVCGNTITRPGHLLNSGCMRSCGCLFIDTARRTDNKFRTHGHYATRIYTTWRGMIERCTKPTSRDWKDYGGRGIKVCERWLKFENFLVDMGEQPEGLTLDRFPNNDGNYEPDNCRWATRKQQANNRRSNVLLTFRGTTKSIAEWAAALGITYGAIYTRLRRGLPIEHILKTN